MTNKTNFVKAKVMHHMTPGEMLRTIRMLQELSQNDLAKLTGFPQSNISAYERGARQMGRESALILSL